VQTEEDHSKDEERVDEDDHGGDGGVYDVSDTSLGLILEEGSQKLRLDDFEGEVEDEHQEGGCEVREELNEAQIEQLKLDKKARPFTRLVCELLPHFFKRVGAAVNLSLLLPH
jgi:hypothetical protein